MNWDICFPNHDIWLCIFNNAGWKRGKGLAYQVSRRVSDSSGLTCERRRRRRSSSLMEPFHPVQPNRWSSSLPIIQAPFSRRRCSPPRWRRFWHLRDFSAQCIMRRDVYDTTACRQLFLFFIYCIFVLVWIVYEMKTVKGSWEYCSFLYNCEPKIEFELFFSGP